MVGAQVVRYYSRSDVTYIPFSDAPPLEWISTWLASPTPATTARILSFNRAAQDVLTRIH